MKIVSIIVPVYKVEKYLDKCIESIVNQSYKNLEIILVDDGSPDNCPKMCDEWAKKDKRIKVIHKNNGGVSSARNIGMQNASGKFVLFVDSDDWIEHEMCEQLINKQKEKDSDFVFCGLNFVYGNKKFKLEELSLSDFCKTHNLGQFIVRENSINEKTQTITYYKKLNPGPYRILFKREKIVKIKFNEKVRYGEDFLFLMECFSKNNTSVFDFIPKSYYNYLQRDDSVVHNNYDWIIDDSKRFMEYLFSLEIGQNLKNAEKFLRYADLYLRFTRIKHLERLNELKGWVSRQNYKCAKNFYFGTRSKLRYFIVYKDFSFIFKFYNKIRRK